MRVSWLPVLMVASFPALAAVEASADPVEPSTTTFDAAPSQGAAAVDHPGAFTHRRREVPSTAELPAAVGVNSPLGWYRKAFATSLYVGVSPHHAIRANVAYYQNADLLRDFMGGVAGAEIAYHSGRLIDLGASLVWYPRKRWQGPTLEAGALVRDRAIRDDHEFEVVKNWTTTFAGRGMIGWSWRFGAGFVAAAVGLSAGYEVGREATTRKSFSNMPTTTTQLARLQVDGEAYLRLGLVLGD